MIVEAMAQVGGIVLKQMADMDEALFVFAGIDIDLVVNGGGGLSC